uniref:Uncharacterized protein n=1 Tax=viral metagenome TaxID=1070528 RepID=A0A6C0HFQ7_9ZZZZ
MFRGLSLLQNNETFIDHNDFVKTQTYNFTKKYPNSYLTTQTDPALIDSTASSLGVWDPDTRQVTGKKTDLNNLLTSVEINDSLKQQQQQCITSDIDKLITSQNLNSKLRCGWIYKKGTPGNRPEVSQGTLATRNGPMSFFDNPKGVFYWDLDAAKKQILKDRCSALVNCQYTGSDDFKECAFSSSRGIGVPVDSYGNVLYPRDPSLNAPNKSLVKNASSCPPPPPVNSPQYAYQQSRDSCTPLPNGQLSRDCMLQQITAAGCKQDGSLYQSLITSAQPNNYAAGLQGLTSYKKYQQFANVPLLDSSLRDGKTTKDIILANFKELSKQTEKINESALNFASRDLCLKRGTMDSYNFCNELTDASTAPFDLGCLQEAFRKAGGQPNGTMYPSLINKNSYDGLMTWKAVKEYINDISKMAFSSNNMTIQSKGLEQLLGITRLVKCSTPTNNGLPKCLPYTDIRPGWPNPACGERVTVFGHPKFSEYNFSIPIGEWKTLKEIKSIPGNNGYTIHGGDGNVSFVFPDGCSLILTINNGENFSGPVTMVFTQTCSESIRSGSCGQIEFDPRWTYAQSIRCERA